MATFRADIEAANDNRRKRRLKWALSLLGIFAFIAAIVYFEGKRYLFEGLPRLPTKEAMWNLNVKPSVTLLDKDGNQIGHRGPYYGKVHKLTELPAHLPAAFLAIEDQRFYEHAGVDRKAILRAVFENTKAGDKVQGGSTLTQQLVKNMVLTPEKNYRRKFQEAYLSYEIEQTLSKTEILELYLNRIYLGHSAYGIEAASQRYFGKSAIDVSLAEAALLAALPKAPSRYDPISNPGVASSRTNLVLQAMFEQGMISATDMSDAEVNPAVIAQIESGHIAEADMGYAFDMIADRARGLIGGDVQDLVIRSTIDPDLQKAAIDSVKAVITKYEKTRKVSEGALISIDASNGAVRAVVGGRDYTVSKFNRATQAKRQPGSSFKAFVYAAALENGFTPGTVRIDQPINIAGWKPENYSKTYKGPINIREALKLSINTVAAQVGAEIGPSKVVELANRFGIASQLGAHYSISLGASEVTLMDMTQAYMVFANEGLKRSPYLIESVTDTSGTPLYSHKGRPPERVYSAPYARQMTSMLRDVVDTGTGHGARMGNRQVAGKTGTSQDFRDAWFIGFSRQYVTGVWMGNDDNSPMRKVTGGLLPVDAWVKYMRAAHKGVKYRPLRAPDPTVTDPETLKLMVFYEGLTEALVTERDLANGAPGIGSPP
ncbi:MAG: PBP1A family penicillin-binding protein [Robiginitomaculum sp.]